MWQTDKERFGQEETGVYFFCLLEEDGSEGPRRRFLTTQAALNHIETLLERRPEWDEDTMQEREELLAIMEGLQR
jgi:hypothetical protein